MEDLIEAVEKAASELDNYYDGAPDSPTIWLGSIIEDLRNAATKATRVMHAWQAEQEEARHRRNSPY